MRRKEKRITLFILLITAACFNFLLHAADQASVYPEDKRLSASIIIDGQVTDWYNIKYSFVEGIQLYSVLDDKQLAVYLYSNIVDEKFNFYIDADLDSATGYQSASWSSSGFEFMVKENQLFSYDGSAAGWALVCPIMQATNRRIIELSIPLSCLNLSEPQDMRMAVVSASGLYYPSSGKELIAINTYITGNSGFLIPPENLRIYTDKTTVRIEWDSASGVNGYEVYFNGTIHDVGTATSFVQENLKYGQKYGIQVRSVGAGLVSCWSSYIYARIVDGQAPQVPVNLTAGQVSFHSVSLVWDSAVDNTGTAGYLIYRDGNLLTAVKAPAYEDTGLTPDTHYIYAVAGYDLAGNISGLSLPLEIATKEEPDDVTILLEDNANNTVIDAFLQSANPDTNYGNTSYLGSFNHFAIRFTLPEEIAGREIMEAKLAFYVWNQTNYQPGQYLDLYLIEKSWEEASVTWNNADSSALWNSPGGDYGQLVGRILHAEGSANWNHTFYPPVDVTAVVQDWATGTKENFGFMLVNDSSTGIGLKASEYGTGKRPYLSIKYRYKNDTQPPAAPGNLSAKALSDSAIELTWSKAVDNTGVTGYRVFRNNTQIAEVAGLTYTDSGLTGNTPYTYTVCAFDKAGNVSPHSASASAVTFPLLVEKTIRLEAPDVEVRDAFLQQASPDTNYGATNYLSRSDHFAIFFNFPAELYQKRIIDAKIAFYVWNQSDYQPNQYMDLYLIEKPWEEATVTWNNANSSTPWNTPGGDYGELVGRILHTEGSDHTFYPDVTVTQVVQDWINGTRANNGFILVNDSVTGIGLKASEYSAGCRPYLLVTYSSYPGDDTQPPTVPTGLTGQAVSTSQINLGWNESTDNYQVTGYKVYRDGGEIAVINSTSFTDTDLAADTAYTYSVAAFDYSGNISGRSPSITVCTESAGTLYYTLSITAENGSVMRSPAQTRYEAGSAVILTAAAYDNYSFQSWSGDLAGTENPVTIIMNSNKNIIALFAAVPDTEPPTIPAGLEAVLVTHNRIDIKWLPAQDNDRVAGYRIYRNGTQLAEIETLSYSNTGLITETVYVYRVSAFDPSNNESAWSEALTVTTTSVPVTGAIIVDHTSCNMTAVPQSAVENAKSSLVIAYGHTSHGSQVTTGMSGLVSFMNGKGYPANLYAWNSSGSGGALILRDSPFSGASDLGNPDRTAWDQASRSYLNSHPEVNVIIWSWCGQVSDASEADINTYLTLMNQLEQDFPAVKFVYMTGHLDGTGASGNLNLRNQQIRDYCRASNKILFDFADIESYDPGGTINYMVLNANDNCDYDSDGNGSRDKNWATDWQNSHTQNVDWYACSSAHSQSLNANLKAYAAWHLWARLAGWSPGN